MWIFLNNAFVSVVRGRGKELLIRARRSGDISRALGMKIQETESFHTDYRYRTSISRSLFAAAMKRHIENIDYANFKDSILGDRTPEDFDYDSASAYQEAASQIWNIMYDLQPALPPYDPLERDRQLAEDISFKLIANMSDEELAKFIEDNGETVSGELFKRVTSAVDHRLRPPDQDAAKTKENK